MNRLYLLIFMSIDLFQLIIQIKNMQSTFKKVLITFLLFWVCLGQINRSPESMDKPLFTQNCVVDQQIFGQPINPQEHFRMLQTSTPHPFKLFGQFPTSTNTNINIDILKKLFGVSAAYFSQVIQVTQIPLASTVYNHALYGICGIDVPLQYANGFDQTIKDSIIMNIIENEPTMSHIARASVCVHPRWSTYGYVKYNAPKIDTDLTKFGVFQNTLSIVMHQLVHVLGVSKNFYSRFFGSYTNPTFISNSSVFQQITGSDNVVRWMIITPLVKSYVQNYFGCSNTSLGAYLEDDNNNGTIASHFERKIYYDQLMTSSDMSAGIKITALTLTYLKDTGFFYSVDTTKAWAPYFGKGKGCDFLQGVYSGPEQYCTGSIQGCDFYNAYGAHCSAGDSYMPTTYTMRGYSNLLCQYEETIRTSGPLGPSYFYNSESRCFSINNFPYCFKAQCTANGIQFMIKNTPYTCGPSDVTKSTIQGTVTCPTDQQRFCARTNCPNFCSTQGVCIQGICLLAPCNVAIPQCLNCNVDDLNRCIQCEVGLFPIANKTACEACSNIKINCQTCIFQNNQTKCSACMSQYVLSLTTGMCILCNTQITNCRECSYDETNSSIICNQCNNGYSQSIDRASCLQIINNCGLNGCISCVLAPQERCINCQLGFYLSSNSYSCISCDSMIPGCQQCSNDMSNILHCQRCVNGSTLSSDGMACSSYNTNCIIPNCITCTLGVPQLCINCSIGFYLSIASDSCILCDSMIPDCQQCSNDMSNVLHCQRCINGSIPSPNGDFCVQFRSSCTISDCTYCSFDSVNGQLCINCSIGFYLSTASDSCITCDSMIPDCQQCSNDMSNVLHCQRCAIGSILSPNGLSCVFFRQNCTIPNCVYCSEDIINGQLCANCSIGFYLSTASDSCILCDSMIPDCQQCSNDMSNVLHCQRCISGSTLAPNGDFCIQFRSSCTISDCTYCSFDSVNGQLCINCSIGFYLSTTSDSCILCDSMIPYCQQCSNDMSNILHCQRCVNGSTLSPDGMACSSDNTNCIIPNCIICTLGVPQLCINCSIGFYLSTASDSCILCDSMIPDCQQCSNDMSNVLHCQRCISGSTLSPNGDFCVQFRSSCTISDCTYCSFDSVNGQLCINCSIGFYLSTARHSCILCDSMIPDCQQCLNDMSNVLHCQRCVSGSTLSPNGDFCIQFRSSCTISDCTYCSFDSVNGQLCINCSIGFYLSTANDSCISCDSMITGCQSCYIDQFTNALTCILCNTNTILITTTSTCVNCSEAFPQCLLCQVINDIMMPVCITCNNGFFPDFQFMNCKLCEQIIYNCSICQIRNQQTICSVCLDRFIFDSINNLCVSCQTSTTHCQTCSINSNMLSCGNCQINFYHHPTLNICSVCENIIPGCLICQEINRVVFCTSCGQDFIKSSDNKSCQWQQDCTITDCVQCSFSNNQTICITCSSSLFPSLDLLSCTACSNIITDCSSCVDTGVLIACQACSNNMFIGTNKQLCVSCGVAVLNCSTCWPGNSTTYCSLCTANNYPTRDNLRCLACNNVISNCTTCSMNGNRTNCIGCITNYFPSQDALQCKICSYFIPNCNICSNSSSGIICSSCNAGFFPNVDFTTCSVCSLAINNCSSCSLDNNGVTICASCSGTLVVYSNLCSTCSIAITNCTSCHNDALNVICSRCTTGLYVQNNVCVTCSVKISGCVSCYENTTGVFCSRCSVGYLNSDNSACVDCNVLYPNCTNCSILSSSSSKYLCASCDSTLFPITTNEQCVVCGSAINDCISCSVQNAVTSCSECGTLYVSKNQLACQQCNVVISSCNVCMNYNGITKCHECASSLFPSSNLLTCQNCSTVIKYCSTCAVQSIKTVCNACGSGLYPSLNKINCLSCNKIYSNCYQCSVSNAGVTSCSSCFYNFYFDGNSCVQCTLPCQTCSSTANNCNSCFDGYYLSGNTCLLKPPAVGSGNYGGTCNIAGSKVACERGCEVCSCSSVNAKICTISSEGFAINSNSQAVQCATGCSSCNGNNPTSCNSCYDRFALQIASCVPCHSSCTTCSQSDPNICLSCPQTYTIGTDNLCSKCSVSNCKQCDNAGKCKFCLDGYSVVPGGQSCQQCLVTCAICSQTDITDCVGCGYMQYLDNNNCKSCPQGCLSCSSATVCKSCINGYHISTSDSRCYKNCILPCLTCENGFPNKCDSCLAGYSHNSTSKTCTGIYSCAGSCQVCPLGSIASGNRCLTCTDIHCYECPASISTCKACQQGYYLSSASCLQCPVQCSSCLDNSICTSCNDGYTLVEDNSNSASMKIIGQCIACQSPCATCAGSPKKCESCIQGYKKQGWKCLNSVNTGMGIILDFNFAEFIKENKLKQFVDYVMKEILNADPQQFSGLDLRSSSTFLNAQIGAPSSSSSSSTKSQCSQSEAISSALGKGSTVLGVSILTSSITSTTGATQCAQENSSIIDATFQYYILFIIIGLAIAIPICITLIIITVLVIRKIANRPEKIKIDDKSMLEVNAEEKFSPSPKRKQLMESNFKKLRLQPIRRHKNLDETGQLTLDPPSKIQLHSKQKKMEVHSSQSQDEKLFN